MPEIVHTTVAGKPMTPLWLGGLARNPQDTKGHLRMLSVFSSVRCKFGADKPVPYPPWILEGK
jgi:hypothetical protein